MLVSPKAQEAQIQAWKESIQESERQGDHTEVARKTDILNKVIAKKSMFLGYPPSKILAEQASNSK